MRTQAWRFLNEQSWFEYGTPERVNARRRLGWRSQFLLEDTRSRGVVRTRRNRFTVMYSDGQHVRLEIGRLKTAITSCRGVGGIPGEIQALSVNVKPTMGRRFIHRDWTISFGMKSGDDKKRKKKHSNICDGNL